MARRACPIARVKLYEAGVQSRAKYDGFGRYDLAGDLVGRNQVQVSQVEALGLWDGQGYRARYPAAMHVGAGGLSTVLCRPFLDTSQGVGLGHFRPVAGRWRALRGLGLNEEIRLYQEDGTPNLVTGVESGFTLPHNPLFGLALWRAEPGSGHNWGQPPYTEIHFGIGDQEEWAIVVPYGSPMFMTRRQGGTWQRVPHTERALHLPSLEGMARGQRSFLWFGVLEGKAVLSTDGFAQDVMVCELPEGAVEIRRGKVSLWHNAGQWSFSFFPVKMALATIHSGAIESGYLTQESAGEVRVEGRTLPVRDDAGNTLTWVELVDDTAERDGLSATQRSWRVRMMPYLHYEANVGTDPDTGQDVEFSTWVSPEWLATQVVQDAEVETDAGLEGQDISGDVLTVSGEETEELLTARYQARLDGQLGTYKGMAEHRRVTVEVGWLDDAGGQELAQVCDGFVVEPPLTVLPGGAAEAEINLLDGMLRLRDEKADGRTPVFDGWPVVDVFRWVLGRCGVGEAQQDLEDTGATLTMGTAAEPVWQVEPGRSWTEFLEEVARFDYNATIWFGGDGVFRKACRYCREQRTAEDVTGHTGALGSSCSSEVTWELYTRGAVAADPEQPGEILELRRHRRSLGAEEYANYVVVCGTGADGLPVRAVMYDAESVSDPTSDRFVGWRKMDVWTLPGLVGQATANRLAAERLTQLSPRPERIVLATPLLPEARLGQVIRINGGETVGAARQLYRISGVRHEVSRHPEQVAATVLQAWWLGSDE